MRSDNRHVRTEKGSTWPWICKAKLGRSWAPLPVTASFMRNHLGESERHMRGFCSYLQISDLPISYLDYNKNNTVITNNHQMCGRYFHFCCFHRFLRQRETWTVDPTVWHRPLVYLHSGTSGSSFAENSVVFQSTADHKSFQHSPVELRRLKHTHYCFHAAI